MHSFEPKQFACMGGIKTSSENGCRQQQWGERNSNYARSVSSSRRLTHTFLERILHPPSCFNGLWNGNSGEIRVLNVDAHWLDSLILQLNEFWCLPNLQLFHQDEWMDLRCHLVIFDRIRLVWRLPPFTDSAKRQWLGMVSMATVDSERDMVKKKKNSTCTLDSCTHTAIDSAGIFISSRFSQIWKRKGKKLPNLFVKWRLPHSSCLQSKVPKFCVESRFLLKRYNTELWYCPPLQARRFLNNILFSHRWNGLLPHYCQSSSDCWFQHLVPPKHLMWQKQMCQLLQLPRLLSPSPERCRTCDAFSDLVWAW